MDDDPRSESGVVVTGNATVIAFCLAMVVVGVWQVGCAKYAHPVDGLRWAKVRVLITIPSACSTNDAWSRLAGRKGNSRD